MTQQLPSLSIADYDYALPEERIARYPVERGQSRLLVNRGGKFHNKAYRSLPAELPPESLLLVNETKVVQARLLFPRATGSIIEVFCLEPIRARSVEESMQAPSPVEFRCLVGGAKKWKEQPLVMEGDSWRLEATKLGREGAYFSVRLSWDTPHSFGEILELAGKTPLPPYLKRAAEERDKEDYQTVFASRPGSVAAPTASLHFTEELLHHLEKAGHSRARVTLHVGAGTFRPVQEEDIREHEMHAEEVWMEREQLAQIVDQLEADKPIIPVGTTALRALESSYQLGRLWMAGTVPQLSPAHIPQWAGFDATLPAEAPVIVFRKILEAMNEENLARLRFDTQLIIAPGYSHRIVSGLITNFHQPRSTLLLLVASLLGPQWRNMYQWALQERFRFLSYGDGQLLLPFPQTK